jgi:hypothetical protein
MALAVTYAIPVIISMVQGRREVDVAPWHLQRMLGWTVNIIAVLWITFEVVLFSMPSVLPVDEVTMNYASVVFVGIMAMSGVWYVTYAHKGQSQSVAGYFFDTSADTYLCTVYKGPPESAGIVLTAHA